MELWWIVPAHNESDVIEEALARLERLLGSTRCYFRIIVVDDGSTDSTPRILEAISSPHLVVVRNETNRGKGHALKLGFDLALVEIRERCAHDAIVGYIDADLDLSPDSIPVFLAEISSGLADVVVGSKLHPNSQVSYPKRRRIASKTFRIVGGYLLTLPVRDTQVGLKTFRAEVLETITPLLKTDGFSFDFELVCLSAAAGYQVREAPVVLDFDVEAKLPWRPGIRAFADLWRIRRYLRRLEAQGSLQL